MAVTKNALIRYQTLDKCFRNPGRRYGINDLLEACNNSLIELNPLSEGIRKRQLYDDIKFMQSSQGWAIPLEIIKEGRKAYYRYEDKTFSINNQPLNQLEADQLKSAIQVLQRFKGLPQFNWINELIPKLDQSFGLSKETTNIISFENNEYLKGIDYLTPLFNAVLYQKTLKITYQSFKNPEPVQIIFYPWHLKGYNNRWFLFGRNKDFSNLTNLALDRIVDIQESNELFVENKEIDFEDYFDDFIGVTKTGDTLEKIVIKANPNQAEYIKTKPVHASQKRIDEDENGYTFSIEVIPNYELERLLLSFGDNIKVIEPSGLREKLLINLKKNLDQY